MYHVIILDSHGNCEWVSKAGTDDPEKCSIVLEKANLLYPIEKEGTVALVVEE